MAETGNGPILLVEDDANDITLTLRALKTNHVTNEVVVAHDGVEALDYLFATGSQAGQPTVMPDLILLDLKLPKVDGLEVLQRIRADERTRLLPVIVLTSSNEDQDRVDSYDLGAISYVRKPVDFGQFFKAVVQRGLYWKITNQASAA